MDLEKKADSGSLFGAVFIAGYIACAAVNHVQELWSQHGQLQVIETKVVPKLKAQAAQVPALAAKAGCEHWRADVNASVAKQAIRGANSDSVPVPDASALPADHCDSGNSVVAKRVH